MDNAYELCRQELRQIESSFQVPMSDRRVIFYLKQRIQETDYAGYHMPWNAFSKAWQYYLRYREKKAGAKAVSVSSEIRNWAGKYILLKLLLQMGKYIMNQ